MIVEWLMLWYKTGVQLSVYISLFVPQLVVLVETILLVYLCQHRTCLTEEILESCTNSDNNMPSGNAFACVYSLA